ncbi:hypothetical protein HK104_003899, partial [Borealophlyctis nickersoniae]
MRAREDERQAAREAAEVARRIREEGEERQAARARMQEEEERRRREEGERAAAVSERPQEGWGGDDDGGNDDAFEEEEPMGIVDVPLAQALAEMQAETDDLRRQTERRLDAQTNMIQEQQRMLQQQTNLIQSFMARLEVSGAPMPPQPPTTTHYPTMTHTRPSSPTPSTSTSITEADATRDIAKSMLASIPKYDGLGNAQKLYEFLQRVEEYLDIAELPAKQQVAVARMMMQSHQAMTTDADEARDWQSVKRLLLERFTTEEEQLLIRKQLLHIKQTSTVTDYTHRFDMLLMQLPERDSERTLVTLYLEGLKEEVKKAVSMTSDNLKDLRSLRRAALRFDQ